jgi:hypothetical protein
MATCRPTLFLLTVKEILLVDFIITNFRVAHKMLCTPWLRNPLTTSRLSCLGRKAALTTIFLSKVGFRSLAIQIEITIIYNTKKKSGSNPSSCYRFRNKNLTLLH